MMIAELERLEASGTFAMLDVELARTLTRLAGERDDTVLLAVALVSRALRDGHVCLPLASVAGAPLRDEQGAATSIVCPELETLREQLVRSPLVGTHTRDARPLVLDAAGRLYLSRYFDHELVVARHFARLSQAPCPALPVPRELDEQLFPQRAGVPDHQREAVLSSQRRMLSILVGGPGTGKTSTCVKLLAVLAASALASGQEPPKVLLLAPTGKAAQRLSEAIGSARDKLPVSEAVRAAIPLTALTIHRALKASPNARTRFRHSAREPLDCDVLLLDEASMVDLALMRHLLDALPAHARLIMLGDPDQLSAVEAGGVLTDLCLAASAPESPLAASLSRLTESYRYARDSGIAQLAGRVHAQDADGALRILRAGHADVGLIEKRLDSPDFSLFSDARKGYAGLGRDDRTLRLQALDQFRVLCAHRRGPGGVLTLNTALARAVHGARAHSEHYAGRPLLINQNDYAARLFNGDVGVEHPSRRGGPLCAYFRSETGEPRELSLSRLPSCESVYAMTVHKSQGSEFDEVAIVLPEAESPLATRELLFTAITRARRAVRIYASEASVRAAIAQRVARHSGLAAALAREALLLTRER
jgi:exodeoxyribonuclease V alpha subunit